MADHPPGPRADRGAARRAGDRHLRLDGRLRVRARADLLDPDRRARQIGGRCATALFGNSAALLSDGTRPLALVPGIRTGGGTAFAGDAIELVSDQLEMTNPRRPRFLYVLRTAAGATPEPALSGSGGSPSTTSRRSTSRSGSRRWRGMRPHPRDHRPRAGARPDRRRHDRRAAGARPPRDPASTQLKETTSCPTRPPPPQPGAAALPGAVRRDHDRRQGRRGHDRAGRARAARARPQRAPRHLPRGDRAARRNADAHRTADPVHRPPPRRPPPRCWSTTGSGGCSPRRPATNSPAATGSRASSRCRA